MKSLVLAGGTGTRLRGIIKDRPKPMARVGDKPFLEYLVLQLRRYDLTDILFCTGYLGEQIKNYFEDGSRWGVHILYSQEKKPLGTGGAIKLAQRYIIEENFLVMNGDSFLNADLTKLITYHLKRKLLATLALTRFDNIERYGAVDVNNENGEIKRFVEKRAHSKSMPWLINAGIYVLRKEIFDYIPDGKVSLEQEVFPQLIGKGFAGVPIDGFFIDIGSPEDYKRIQENPQILRELRKMR
jgi:NDP-sugar pyrophosphorylase family protein